MPQPVLNDKTTSFTNFTIASGGKQLHFLSLPMPRHSPARERERSPARRRSSRRSISPVRATTASRKGATRSPLDGDKRHSKRSEAKSPPPRSPSPRTKRLRRVEVERNGRGRHREREKGSERDDARERGEKRSERDSIGGGEGSKSRRDRLASSDHRPRDRRERPSRSPPPRDARKGAHEEENIYGEAGEDGADDSISKMKAAEDVLESKQKQKPSFELSGKLASETNRVRGVTLLFDEPPDARKPDIRWRLYVFKAGEVLNEPLYIHRRSCYLFGRERRVADIPTDHPSCSKQHAVIQFRQVEKEQADGMLSKQTRPYLMDLGSTNKTFLNDNPIEPQRYYELFEKDTIKLGNSSREYVLLHENSAT